jgi:ribokinase
MADAPRIAVIGHVEWITFGAADRPPTQGDILHLKDPYEVPAGGGAVSAVVLARLGAQVTFFTALGDDRIGRESERQLRAQGLELRAARRPRPQTTGLTVTDPDGERTIFVIGPNAHPVIEDDLGWDDLAGMDAVYFTGDDPRTLVAARAARAVVSTARRLPAVIASRVRLDALVGSGNDEEERIDADALPVAPRVIVETDGRHGGRWRADDGRSGSWEPLPLPGPVRDAYGAGDSFVAGVTYGLAAGWGMDEAVRLGARCGAEAVTRRGPYDGPLS